MQQTRFSALITALTRQLTLWLVNPWRRLSVTIISLLSGNFFATAVSSTAGQAAELDIVITAVLLIFVEGVSWLVYGREPRLRATGRNNVENGRSPLLFEALNAFKLGLTYGLFVEGFKLGS